MKIKLNYCRNCDQYFKYYALPGMAEQKCFCCGSSLNVETVEFDVDELIENYINFYDDSKSKYAEISNLKSKLKDVEIDRKRLATQFLESNMVIDLDVLKSAEQNIDFADLNTGAENE